MYKHFNLEFKSFLYIKTRWKSLYILLFTEEKIYSTHDEVIVTYLIWSRLCSMYQNNFSTGWFGSLGGNGEATIEVEGQALDSWNKYGDECDLRMQMY
jgi:hypothetical protein